MANKAKSETKNKGFFIRITESKKKAFKMKCVEKGTDMTKVLDSFMDEFINQK